jgi:hypothetical protein
MVLVVWSNRIPWFGGQVCPAESNRRSEFGKVQRPAQYTLALNPWISRFFALLEISAKQGIALIA